MPRSETGSSVTGRRRSMPAVESVARAARVLRMLCHASEGLSLADVSSGLGLNKTTALRLLRTLAAERMARRDATTGRYYLDVGLWLSSAHAVEEALSFRSAAQALLAALAKETGATAFIMIPDLVGRRMVPTLWALPDRPVRMDPSATTIQMQSMHANAGGKCYLAGLSDDELLDWVSRGMPKLTPNTLATLEELRPELAQVRTQGYALNRQENALGSSGLAVPIRDRSGEVVASLSFAVMPEELTEANLRKWVPQLLQASARLSQLMRSGAGPVV